MIRLLARARDDRGATALIVAAGMVLFLGMAALAIDIGFGFNERRQDQTAADTGVMAGAVGAINGGPAVRDQTLTYVRNNLDTTYSNAAWQSAWQGCVDPAADRNAGGYNFIALTPPAGWSVTDPANWCISFESARGLLRVRVPDQLIETSFASVLGVDDLRTHATAVSRVRPRGSGGILPFGLPNGASGLRCLSSGPSGQAVDPCVGALSGNFGVLRGPLFGNSEISTPQRCNAQPPGEVLATNIAVGYDHIVVPDADGSSANHVLDQCFNNFVDTLDSDPGFPNNSLERGLAGPTPFGHTPRLEQTTNPTNVFGNPIDNQPLWQYLLPGVDYGGTNGNPADDAPASCNPQSFINSPPNVPFDWNGDGILDRPGSWQHMDVCIDAYNSGGFTTVMFSKTLGQNAARFGYVPEFWENSLGSGGSDNLHVKNFKAVFLETTTWRRSATNVRFHSPGEPCMDGSGAPAACTGNYSLWQLTAFVLPDSSLPLELRGSKPSGGSGLNPYDVELYD